MFIMVDIAPFLGARMDVVVLLLLVCDLFDGSSVISRAAWWLTRVSTLKKYALRSGAVYVFFFLLCFVRVGGSDREVSCWDGRC